MKWLFLHKAQTGENNYYNLIQLKNLFISTKFTPLSLLFLTSLFLLSLSLSPSPVLSANAVKNYNQIWLPFHTKDIQNHNLFMALEIFVLWFTYHASIHTGLVSFWSVVLSLPYWNQYKFFPFQKKHTTFSVLKENLSIIMINSVYHVFDRIS